jgi:ubiquinone/menaquinone biosynthesis C-methylase UbiE
MAQERFFGEQAMPDVAAQWRDYFRLLDVREGHRVLDVGCHEGDAIALLLTVQPDVRRVVGLDRNERKAEHVRRRFAGEGRVEAVHADILAASLADHEFDRIYCAETLEWVSEPIAGLREMRRMLAPGGLAMAIHTDFDTQVFASDDLDLTRMIVHEFTDQGRRGTIGRELVGLCVAAGFSRVEPSVRPLVSTSFSPGLYPRRIVDMMRVWLVEKGDFDASAFDGWAKGLEDRDREGRFFYSVNRNICVCRT